MAYEIGETEVGLTDLADLTVPVEYPTSKKYFQPYAVYKRLGDGSRKGYGLPRTRWLWPHITQEERDQLQEFFEGAASVTLYITTRLPDDTYDSYVCIAHWPDEEPAWVGGYFQNFAIDFTNLEAV